MFKIVLQEFGDSARARKLYEQDSDDDDDEELEPNPKLEQGMQISKTVSQSIAMFNNVDCEVTKMEDL